MEHFLIPDSLFLHPNIYSCGSGLKICNAFEFHGNCWEIPGNCSLLWNSCWAEKVLPLTRITAVAAAITQGPRAIFVITSAWWPKDCMVIGEYEAPVAVLGGALMSRCRACHGSSSTQQQVSHGEREKEDASHYIATKWLILLQELCKIFASTKPG